MKTPQRLQPISRVLCYVFDGWIVGGAVPYISCKSEESPKDIDIIVSPNVWREVSLILPKNSILNTLGGMKFIDNGVSVDVWPDEIGRLLTQSYPTTLYSPIHNVTIGKI